MPDVMIVAPVGANIEAIVSLSTQEGIRTKELHSLEHGEQWVEMRQFDIVFLHSFFPRDKRVNFAEKIWRKSPFTYVVVFNFEDGESLEKSKSEEELSGFEFASGTTGENVVAELVEKVASVRTLGKDMPQVMVVEDLDSPRDIICSYVEALGICNAIGKSSARLALEDLEENPEKWSCIITDIRMPDIDGKEFLKLVRRHGKLSNLPVIMLTAYGTVDMLIDCLKAGASGFMVKPPRKKDLVREISRALRLYRDGRNPRLATRDEAEVVRDFLVRRGFEQ